MIKVSSPSYLSKNPYNYCFRMRIPQDLQEILARKELRYSLKTGNLSKAKTMSRLLARQIQLFFQNIRRGYLSEMNLSTSQIQEILKKYLQKLIQDYDKPAIPDWQTADQNQHTWASDQDAVEGSIQVLSDLKAEYNANIHSGAYAEAEPIAVQLLAEQGMAESDIDKSSPVYHSLCSGILRAKIKEFEHQQARLSGNYSDNLEIVLSDVLPDPTMQSYPCMTASSSIMVWNKSLKAP